MAYRPKDATYENLGRILIPKEFVVSGIKDKSDSLMQAKSAIFVSIREKAVPYGYRVTLTGYCQENPFVKRIFKKLIQEAEWNRHITLIEWNDRFLVSFEDGKHMSNGYCFVTKEEVKRFKEKVGELHGKRNQKSDRHPLFRDDPHQSDDRHPS